MCASKLVIDLGTMHNNLEKLRAHLSATTTIGSEQLHQLVDLVLSQIRRDTVQVGEELQSFAYG